MNAIRMFANMAQMLQLSWCNTNYTNAQGRSYRWQFGILVFALITCLWPQSGSGQQGASPIYVLGKLPAVTGHRAALVIGNATYTIDPLTNPVSDAEEMAKALQELGFKVTIKENLKKPALVSAISDFGSTLGSQDTVVVYYAGHAVQVNGRNYLVPVDAQGNRVNDVSDEMADIDLILSQLRKAKPKRNIVILDACRDNPWLQPNGWFPGLAPPTGVPPETVIAYSTDPGNVAKDGPVGKHSPYTRALLKYIRQPGLSLDDVFKGVTASVQDNTDKQQNPWINVSLREPFLFRDRAYVYGRILGADDDALVLVNGEESLSWNQDGQTSKQLLLLSGDNSVVVKVYNQHTFTGGVDLSDVNPNLPPGPGHLPEGWNYTFNLCNSSDSVCDCADGGDGKVRNCLRFSGGEDHPKKDGPHHGKLFSVARAVIHVDDQNGEVSLVDVDDKVWQKPATAPTSASSNQTPPLGPTPDQTRYDAAQCGGARAHQLVHRQSDERCRRNELPRRISEYRARLHFRWGTSMPTLQSDRGGQGERLLIRVSIDSDLSMSQSRGQESNYGIRRGSCV